MKKLLAFIVLTISITAQAKSVNINLDKVTGAIYMDDLVIDDAKVQLSCHFDNGFSESYISTDLDTKIIQDPLFTGTTAIYTIEIESVKARFSKLFGSRVSCGYTLHVKARNSAGRIYETSALGMGVSSSGSKTFEEFNSYVSSGKMIQEITKQLKQFTIEIGPSENLWQKQ